MKNFILSGILFAAASASCHADELMLTPSQEKGRTSQQYAIDFVTAGEAVAFQFNIILPKGVDAKQVNLESCLAELPKSHNGQCSVSNGKIIGLVANDTNTPFEAGIIPVGKISINSKSRFNSLKIEKFLVSDKEARPIQASAEFVN